MKTLAYLDCPTGIAGDMCLGALVHAGVPLDYLSAQLNKLGIQTEFELKIETVLRNQQSATKAHVKLLTQHDDHDHQHDHQHHIHQHSSRRLPEIKALITQANLPKRASQWSLTIFQRLAEAEATVHGISPEQVHFHEVGATDAIVDIVGTCLGLDWLQIDELICSPLPTGGGTVRCAHGLLGVPVPAVLNMMASAQVPVYSNGIEKELVTPTGCAIATTLARSFGPPPRFTLQTIGLGAGGRDLALPNILRLWIGTAEAIETTAIAEQTQHAHFPHTHLHRHEDDHQSEHKANETDLAVDANVIGQSNLANETIVELQTQIDDCSPQAIGYLYEQLFAAGALDVFTQAVAMKKNRLGTLITVLCAPALTTQCEMILFAETTTLGIRRTVQTRSLLNRKIIAVATPYGEMAVKVASVKEGEPALNIHPEYEDCAAVARSHNITWQQAHQAALSAASTLLQRTSNDT